MGIKNINKVMRRKIGRMERAQAFAKNEKYHYTLRAIVGETLCQPAHPISIEMILRFYKRFMIETSPGERVPR